MTNDIDKMYQQACLVLKTMGFREHYVYTFSPFGTAFSMLIIAFHRKEKGLSASILLEFGLKHRDEITVTVMESPIYSAKAKENIQFDNFQQQLENLLLDAETGVYDAHIPLPIILEIEEEIVFKKKHNIQKKAKKPC